MISYLLFAGLALNTTSLTGRRDSFDRNTSAFSPSLEYAATARPKWAQGYGAASTAGVAAGGGSSASPLPQLGAPLTPPPPQTAHALHTLQHAHAHHTLQQHHQMQQQQQQQTAPGLGALVSATRVVRN